MKNAAPTHLLYNASDAVSARHIPSWLLLAAAAGATNAGVFLAGQRFVTHVTGTVTRIGLDAGAWMLMAEYTLVLAAFVFGAFLSVFGMQGRVARGLPPAPHIALLGVSAILTVVALAGRAGVFGAFGETVEQPADFALLWTLAFAMGLMNATVASSTAVALRTTHMTGPATDLGVGLGVALFSTGPARADALALAALRGGKLVAFVAGAVLMASVAERLDYLAFAAPAIAIVAATARSLLPRAATLAPAYARTQSAH